MSTFVRDGGSSAPWDTWPCLEIFLVVRAGVGRVLLGVLSRTAQPQVAKNQWHEGKSATAEKSHVREPCEEQFTTFPGL